MLNLKLKKGEMSTTAAGWQQDEVSGAERGVLSRREKLARIRAMASPYKGGRLEGTRLRQNKSHNLIEILTILVFRNQ